MERLLPSQCLLASEIMASSDASAPGPVSVMLSRCHEAGISWDVGAQALQDSLGLFCPFATSPQEVEQRLALQWQTCVSAKVSLRPGFQGMSMADPVITDAS